MEAKIYNIIVSGKNLFIIVNDISLTIFYLICSDVNISINTGGGAFAGWW